MKWGSTIRKLPVYVALVVSTLILNACAGKSWFSYTGWQAKPDNRAALQDGGPHAAIWKTLDIGLHYRYVMEANHLEIEGKLIRQKRIKQFPDIVAWVSIHFLDENGIILDTHRLWSQRGSTVLWGIRWHFKHRFELPAGARAIAFSYSGTAGDNDTDWDFWRTP